MTASNAPTITSPPQNKMSAPEMNLIRSKSGLRMVPRKGTDACPFTMAEPPWVPDSECKQCMSCQAKFNFTIRRHHCRRCGRCFCGNCCDNKDKLPRMCFVDPVRQCKSCSETSKKENDFFDKHLKTLCNGGDFILVESQITDESPTFRVKLSTNHRVVNFDCSSDKHEPILMEKIDTVQILTSSLDGEGNTVASGIAMKYQNSGGTKSLIKMMVSPSASSRRESQLWIAAMQKAFKMIHDTRMAQRQ